MDTASQNSIFIQGFSASMRDQGEKGIMVLVSNDHCGFLLSHTPGHLSSMLMHKFLSMSQH